ncbi:hypothetical protein ACFLZC_02860 [Patescibacteria group bacterium]
MNIEKGGGMKKEIDLEDLKGLEFPEKKPVDPHLKYENFCCPICSSEEYDQMLGNNGVLGPGGYSWVMYNICRGCSVLFQDAEKFSKKEY